MQSMGKCMQEKTLRTLYLHLVPLIDRYLVVKFKILSKTPAISFFFFVQRNRCQSPGGTPRAKERF